MDEMLERHRRACDGFAAVAARVGPAQWGLPTPCAEWDARAVVEHVIGFHEFLLLRPLGVRAHRPRDDPAARWRVTQAALFEALETSGALDQDVELFNGERARPRGLLPALTIDVLVHTWDLARAVGLADRLDPELCDRAYAESITTADARGGSDMYAAPVGVPDDADTQSRLLALLGRDPAWTPPAA